MNKYVELSLQQWRNTLNFPFSTINLASERLFQLEAERDRLKQIADQLISEWKSFFPRSSVPIYLTKVSDRSLSTLRWRRSKTHSDKASQIPFSRDLLEYFHIEKQQKLVLKFESLRIDLNHKLSVILYEQQRLQTYLTDSKLLSQLRKSSPLTPAMNREKYGNP